MSFITKAIFLVVCLAVVTGLAAALYALGRRDEAVKTVQAAAQISQAVHVKANAKVRTDLRRAGDTGHAREQDRAALDVLFQQLEREAKDAPTAAHDSYVLPDDRLRLWRAANAGRPCSGAAASEPHDGASTAAAACQWANSGLGGEPPRSGEGLSPTGIADVPAAELPADQPAGL